MSGNQRDLHHPCTVRGVRVLLERRVYRSHVGVSLYFFFSSSNIGLCRSIHSPARFLILFSTTSFLAITEDPPIFTGYRTIDVDNVDVDKIQIGTRTVRARNLFLFLTNAPPASFFRLTVIYTRYFKGAIVFKVRSCPFIRIGLDHFRPNTLLTGQQRKHSDRVRYTELTDLLGRFDALKFEAWVRRVMLDAMTVPYGSVWVRSSAFWVVVPQFTYKSEPASSDPNIGARIALLGLVTMISYYLPCYASLTQSLYSSCNIQIIKRATPPYALLWKLTGRTKSFLALKTRGRRICREVLAADFKSFLCVDRIIHFGSFFGRRSGSTRNFPPSLHSRFSRGNCKGAPPPAGVAIIVRY